MGYPDRIESLIEAQIKAAQQNGEFDNLPGAGKPLPGHGEPYDENWWINEFVRREGVTGEATLPPSIKLARDVERLPDQIRTMASEQRVREAVTELNARVEAYRRRPTHPYVPVRPVDLEQMVALWRESVAAHHAPQGGPRTRGAGQTKPAARWGGWLRRRSRPADPAA